MGSRLACARLFQTCSRTNKPPTSNGWPTCEDVKLRLRLRSSQSHSCAVSGRVVLDRFIFGGMPRQNACITRISHRLLAREPRASFKGCLQLLLELRFSMQGSLSSIRLACRLYARFVICCVGMIRSNGPPSPNPGSRKGGSDTSKPDLTGKGSDEPSLPNPPKKCTKNTTILDNDLHHPTTHDDTLYTEVVVMPESPRIQRASWRPHSAGHHPAHGFGHG